jgi:hypothetical protein
LEPEQGLLEQSGPGVKQLLLGRQGLESGLEQRVLGRQELEPRPQLPQNSE